MFELDIRPSRLALLFLLLFHLCASLALCLTELPDYLLVAFLLALGHCGVARVRAELPGSSMRVLRAQVNQLSWNLECQQDEKQFQPPSVIFCSEWLIVLQFNCEINAVATGSLRPQVLTLWPDSLGAVQSRRLRRYLRFECAEELP